MMSGFLKIQELNTTTSVQIDPIPSENSVPHWLTNPPLVAASTDEISEKGPS